MRWSRRSAALVVALAGGACAARVEPSAKSGGPPPPPPADAPRPAPVAAAAIRPPSAASLAPTAPACPPEMVLVEGAYCTAVRQDCLVWMDPPGPLARCAKFAPSVCEGERVYRRFCIDRDEYTDEGESLARGDTSWTTAKALCEQANKRLCRESEWQFACEGEEMLPYPYGYERDASRCNFDRGALVDPKTGKLRDYRKPSSELERCVSPFGVRNLTGNVDEWVVRDVTWGPWRSALKGGWWMAARNRCRPATTAHDEAYHDLQTGFRCCADAQSQ